MKLNKKITWTGLHRGITLEVTNWKMKMIDEQKDCWNHYIFIHLDRVPVENDPESMWLKNEPIGLNGRMHYKYNDVDLFNNLDWGDGGGITFYNKVSGLDGGSRVIKIGCDYQHYWNEGRFYDKDWIAMEAKRTIDSFINIVPNYKHWCLGNGNLYLPSEGEILEDGRFVSNEYREAERVRKLNLN